MVCVDGDDGAALVMVVMVLVCVDEDMSGNGMY